MTIIQFNTMEKIEDFRNGKCVQVKVYNKWFNLITMADGTFAIKRKVPKAFNPYFIFNNERDILKINNYLNK